MASRLISTDAGQLPKDLLEDAKYLRQFEARVLPIPSDQPFNEAYKEALMKVQIEKITVSFRRKLLMNLRLRALGL